MSSQYRLGSQGFDRTQDECNFVAYGYGDAMYDRPVEDLRKDLLELDGVGEETADSIILYAINKPKFVIDAYTRRILGCLGLSGSYRSLQEKFESELKHDTEMFKGIPCLWTSSY